MDRFVICYETPAELLINSSPSLTKPKHDYPTIYFLTTFFLVHVKTGVEEIKNVVVAVSNMVNSNKVVTVAAIQVF